MAKEENSLDKLKKNYAKMQKKFSLPEFDVLNCEFQIERLTEVDTDYLIREVRKLVSEKLSNYLRIVEALINPVNAPMFLLSAVKNFSKDDRGTLKEIYDRLSVKEIELIGLDLFFDEKKEVEYIISAFSLWLVVKKDLMKVVEKMSLEEEDLPASTSRNYFG